MVECLVQKGGTSLFIYLPAALAKVEKIRKGNRIVLSDDFLKGCNPEPDRVWVRTAGFSEVKGEKSKDS